VGECVVGNRESGRESIWASRAVATAIALALILTALAVVSVPAKAQTTFRSLRIGVGEDALSIITLNPLKFTLLYEFVVVYNVYSTLVTYDRSYQVVPDLAYEWTLEPDNTNWTFKIVENAYFTNPSNPSDRSHPVTANDVVTTFNILKNTVGNFFANYVENVTAATAVDTYTVRFTLNEPLNVMMTVASGMPILPAYIWSGINNPLSYRNDVPVGSGAMYYDAVNTTTSTLVLRKSPNYYGEEAYCRYVRPDEVRYIGYTSSAVMVQNFLSGSDRLDIIDHIAPSEYKVALGPTQQNPNGWSPKWAVDTGFVGEISVNVMTPEIRASYQQYRPGSNNQLLLNDTLRRAIAMSIDKTALVENALLGLGIPADTLVPSSNPWHYDLPASNEFPFDPAAARQLLNDAGWRYDASGADNPATTPLYKAGGTDRLRFRFYTLNTATQWDIAARNITGWLRQTGIETTDRLGNTAPGYGLYSINQMSGYWYQGDYDIWLWDWIFTPASDPSLDVLSVQLTSQIGGSGSSDNFYSNATFDSLYYQSLKTLDDAARRQLTNQMQRMVYDYASYILPYYRLDLYAATVGRPNLQAGEFPGWSGYGDWEINAGLVDDSDLPNLWFQLSPLDNPVPVISNFAPIQWVNGTPVSVSVSATNPAPSDGALAYTWDFGDGTAVQTTNTNTVDHTFADPGEYAVSVRVTDSEWTMCASTTATIVEPSPGSNLPPQARGLAFTLSRGTFEEPGVPISFNLTVRDPEGDTIEVEWDFDDGTIQTDTVTNTASDRVVQRQHTYSEEGTYTLTIVITDNQQGLLNHTITLAEEIQIEAVSTPPPTGAGNPLLDIGVPVAILVAIAGAIAYVVVRRRRASREEQQREEMGQQPPAPPPPT